MYDNEVIKYMCICDSNEDDDDNSDSDNVLDVMSK